VRVSTPAMVVNQGGCSFGHSLIRFRQTSEGSLVDVAHGEMVEKELDAMIQRRARKGDLDPDEREDLWKASVRSCNIRRREEMRAAWCEHRQGQAARLRTALEALITDHEEQAERYRDQPEGAA
jgi:hypothetical protein